MIFNTRANHTLVARYLSIEDTNSYRQNSRTHDDKENFQLINSMSKMLK